MPVLERLVQFGGPLVSGATRTALRRDQVKFHCGGRADEPDKLAELALRADPYGPTGRHAATLAFANAGHRNAGQTSLSQRVPPCTVSPVACCEYGRMGWL